MCKGKDQWVQKRKGQRGFVRVQGLCIVRYSFVMLSLEKQDVVTLLKNLCQHLKTGVFLIGYNDKPGGPMVSHNLALHKRLLTPLVFTESRGTEEERRGAEMSLTFTI